MGRKARLKRERRNGGAAKIVEREFRRALAATGLESMLVEAPAQERKVSDALLELVQPMIRALEPSQRTLARLEQILAIGKLAWNAYLLPDPEMFLRDTLENLPADDPVTRDIAQRLAHGLLAKRGMLFPHDRRYIAQTFVTMGPDGRFDVSAAYAPAPIPVSP